MCFLFYPKYSAVYSFCLWSQRIEWNECKYLAKFTLRSLFNAIVNIWLLNQSFYAFDPHNDGKHLMELRRISSSWTGHKTTGDLVEPTFGCINRHVYTSNTIKLILDRLYYSQHSRDKKKKTKSPNVGPFSWLFENYFIGIRKQFCCLLQHRTTFFPFFVVVICGFAHFCSVLFDV